MSLSEKRHTAYLSMSEKFFYHEKDVREFIKELKVLCKESEGVEFDCWESEFDELAGKELTELEAQN